MLRALIATALLALGVPASGQSVSYSGTLSGRAGDVVAGQAPFLDGTGVYGVRYSFGRPGGGVLIDYAIEVETSYCFDIGLDTETCGGDPGGSAAPGGFNVLADPAPARIDALYKIARPVRLTGPDFFSNADYSIDQTRFEYRFAADGDVDYTVVVTRLAGVPEPASWTLMLAGFAAVGAACRRARFSRAT